jgi:hypothetical protein
MSKSFAWAAAMGPLLMSGACQQPLPNAEETPQGQVASSATEGPPSAAPDRPGAHHLSLPGAQAVQARPLEPRQAESAAVELRQQALTTSEATLLGSTGIRMSESASAAVQGADGVWQTAVFANTLTATGPTPTGLTYGCVRGSATHCPSMTLGGIQWIRTNQPCDANCGASWQTCSAGMPADFPMAVSADASTFRFVFNNTAAGNNWVSMGVLSWCSNVSWFDLTACGLGSDIRRNAHGVMGGNGTIHVTWANRTTNKVEYMQFNSNNNSWSCNTFKVIHDIIKPNNNCPMGQSGRPVMPILGNGTTKLEFSYAPRIARDATTGALVVTWDSYDSSQGAVRARAFRSADSGVTWDWRLLSLQETGHSVVASGSPHIFEIGNTYNFGLGNTGGQVSWRSTDAGVNWSGTAVSSSRALAPVLGSTSSRPCHWGDYEGLSFHSSNNAFLHSWVDSNQGADPVIRGRFISQ